MSLLAMYMIMFALNKPAPVPAAPVQVSRGWTFKEGIGDA